MASSQRIAGILALLCFVLSVSAEDPPFPHIADLEVEFYQTEVQVASANIEDETAYGLATEYYDSTELRGRLELQDAGNIQSVYFNNDTEEILEINDNKDCKAFEIDESTYSYDGIFYGWLHKDPLIIGPSAYLWYANDATRREKIQYNGTARIRNIACDAYTLKVDGDDVTYTYYFAATWWTTPFQMGKMRVPIRIEANGFTKKGLRDPEQQLPINIINDFIYFRPTISNWLVFQPPLGLGCLLKKPTLTMPTMPDQFMFTAESFDLKQTDPNNPATTFSVNFAQVWYDHKERIARLDRGTRTNWVSELYDFNTGVTYRNEDRTRCTIKPLMNSIFEFVDPTDLMSRIKDPREVMFLDGKFYYMGRRQMRGIMCDSFESVQEDVMVGRRHYDKLVISVFYSLDDYQVSINGEMETKIPIYYMLNGYNDDKNEMSVQYNIFGFSDFIYPHMFTNFGLGACFPTVNDKSYFVLMMNVEEKLSAYMEEQDYLIKELIRGKIMLHAKISFKRIALLSADYKPSGVTVTGLMLDRPPALKQFSIEFEGPVTIPEKFVSFKPEVDDPEKCAYECVNTESFICKGFYMCKNFCVLKKTGILENINLPNEKLFISGENCGTWLRSTIDSNNKEAYLADALKSLEDAVLSNKINITFKIPDLKEKPDVTVPIDLIAIGDGPYTGVGVDQPYDVVINYVKLDPNAKDVTTRREEYVDSLRDCYKACKESGNIACASFSFCPKAGNKQCVLTSTLYVNRKKTPLALLEDPNCYVYSLKYADLYEPYPGRVSLIGGDAAYKGITNLEECARKCREDTTVKCRGFEYCRSEKTCVLHSRHILDLKPGEVEIDTKKASTCVHYAAKFTNDYDDLGPKLLDDPSDTRMDMSLEECAKTCSEELKANCRSFNYCPPEYPGSADGSCSLSAKIIQPGATPTTTKEGCRHYEKKSVDDWRKPEFKGVPQPSGYTSKGFGGLVVGMLALGLVVGALGFVGYSYYKSRSGGDGMTVRFMKQPT